jgi:hypothetical protein
VAHAVQPAQIDRNALVTLIRGTLLALHQGNETGNYTVLRDLGAPGFQSANTAARLSEIFAPQRAQGLDLSSIAVADPLVTSAPRIVQGGLMHVAGTFAGASGPISFELLFAPIDGRWRLFGVSVAQVGSAEAAAVWQQPALVAPVSSNAASSPPVAKPSPSPKPDAAARPAVKAPPRQNIRLRPPPDSPDLQPPAQ